MKYTLFLLTLFLIAGHAWGQQQLPAQEPMNQYAVSGPYFLWPHGAPGVTPGAPPEGPTKDIATVAGAPIIRLSNVTQPSITVYEPSPQNRTGAAVVVCPGGGYQILAWDLEGTEVCKWLNDIGVVAILLKYRVPNTNEATRAILLKYRVPNTNEATRFVAPLQDAQRALGYVRANATQWKVDIHRIGILGFSAGGHLSAALSTNYTKRTYASVDAADNVSCRPDFTLLIYPAYLTQKDQGDQLSAELPVTAQTPPTFLLQTQDDPIRVENSLRYYEALKKAGVPAEIHLYATGGHGYGLRPTGKPVTHWPALAEGWMRQLGLLKR